MKGKTISPIAALHGKLTKDHYVRMLANGTMVIAHVPNREGHVKTDGERANQERFARDWAGGHRTVTVRSGRGVVAGEGGQSNCPENNKGASH